MNLLQELESLKYSMVLDLIKRDESYDKKRNVLSGDEVFKLCQNRYQKMQEILWPLKEKIGNNIEINDICFSQGMQDDTNITVKYCLDDHHNYFIISNMGLNDVSISSSDEKVEKYNFAKQYRKLILDIFRRVYQESLDSEFEIYSTTKKFMIRDNCSCFVIKDVNGKIFSIEGNHSLYAKNNLMYNQEKIISQYQKLKEILMVNENVLNIYKHLKIYEEDYPKILKKLIDN